MTSSEPLPVAGTVVLLRPTASAFEVLMTRRPDRGSFAGAWVFPGGRVEDADRMPGGTEFDDARRAGIRETREEVGLDVRDLVALSQWHPPVDIPTRIRTWFFLCAAPEGDAVPAPDEVVELAWLTPAAALARHTTGDWRLFPPTWLTLDRLASFADAGSALAAAGTAETFRTRNIAKPHGTDFEWDQGLLHTAERPWRFIPS